MAEKRKTELLSPAGSWDALVAAVQSGADAVYLGGTQFSARAGAENFDLEHMAEAVRYCHIRGVKVFVTLNTLLKQKELHEEAVSYALSLYEIGVDALIVQDLGLASLLRLAVPDFPLHASTQMTVHSLAGAQALAKYGFRRIVLARELTFAQIREIKEKVAAEFEIFVHGAICQSYSGQCLFSSFLGGRSGNRGRCAQPCRLPYMLQDGAEQAVKKGYLLSPKDMCLLPHLQEIQQAGIDSLKIEGRLKRPEYVATVTGIYRKYLDSGKKPAPQDIQALLDAFNRSGFTDGYYIGKTGAAMMSYASPSNTSAEKFDAEIKKRFTPSANFRLVDVWGWCEILRGRPMQMTLKDWDGNKVSVWGDVPEEAVSQPLSFERAHAQLSKFGSVPFALKELELTLDEGITVSIRAINALRRAACEALLEQRGQVRRKTAEAASIGLIGSIGDEREELCVEVQTLAQAQAVLKLAPDKLYIPLAIADKLLPFTGKTEIITSLPAIVDNHVEHIYDKIPTKGVRCSSLGAAERLRPGHTVYGSHRLNVYNAAAALFCTEHGFTRVTLSPELNLHDMASLGKNAVMGCDVIVYGHLPLMVMKNCVIKACSGACKKGRTGYRLIDRKRQAFPLLCDPLSCTNTLLNAKPLYMADKIADLKRAGVRKFLLCFTVEEPEACARILEEYKRAVEGVPVTNNRGENSFTRGHFYRGVL